MDPFTTHLLLNLPVMLKQWAQSVSSLQKLTAISRPMVPLVLLFPRHPVKIGAITKKTKLFNY